MHLVYRALQEDMIPDQVETVWLYLVEENQIVE